MPGDPSVSVTDPFKLKWRRGQPAPIEVDSAYGTTAVIGNVAYFSDHCNVYAYRASDNGWTKLPPCRYRYFCLAVVRGQLTTIGGRESERSFTNILLSLSENVWLEDLPPMPTGRELPASASSPTHLVVVGGLTNPRLSRSYLSVVEVLNTETLQWSTACDLPQGVGSPRIVCCHDYFYLSDGYSLAVFCCSVTDLLESTNSSDGRTVWTRLADIPMDDSSLTALEGHVLAICGVSSNYPTGIIHYYDVGSNCWSIIGEVPTPRFSVLTAVLPSNELVVVGGNLGLCINEIGTFHVT